MPKWEQLRNLLLLIALYSLSIPSKMIFYQDLTFREVILYFWTITQALLSFIYTKKFNSKWSILWGVELMVWGWTVSSSYYENDRPIYYLGITPLYIYSIWTTHLIYKTKKGKSIDGLDLDKRKLRKAFFIGVVTLLSLVFSTVMCSANESKSIEIRTNGVFFLLIILMINMFFSFIRAIFELFLKKNYRFLEWFKWLVTMLGGLTGILPAYAGFGWSFAVLTGVPFGLFWYFSGAALIEELDKKDRIEKTTIKSQ